MTYGEYVNSNRTAMFLSLHIHIFLKLSVLNSPRFYCANKSKGGTLAKSRKLFFQGRPFLEGKIQKMQKKISKIFIVPNRSLGHTDHLYTYKGHIEHIGFM